MASSPPMRASAIIYGRDQKFAAALAIVAAVLLFLAMSATLWAHGGLHDAIEHVTAQIAETPNDAWLYFQRGELHRMHQDWGNAAADYDRAATVDPQLAIVDLGRGEMLRAQQQWPAAREALDRFIRRAASDPNGYAARARVWSDLGQPESAAEDYASAIDRSPHPSPELYVAWARARAAAGRTEDALNALAAGMSRLGQAVTLVVPAIDFEVALGRADDALARLDAFTQTQARKERWLLRRGEILEQAGRRPAAQNAYHAARTALRALPDGRRLTGRMQKLSDDLEKAIKRVGEPPGQTKP